MNEESRVLLCLGSKWEKDMNSIGQSHTFSKPQSLAKFKGRPPKDARDLLHQVNPQLYWVELNPKDPLRTVAKYSGEQAERKAWRRAMESWARYVVSFRPDVLAGIALQLEKKDEHDS
jgi:hypothetical protein